MLRLWVPSFIKILGTSLVVLTVSTERRVRGPHAGTCQMANRLGISFARSAGVEIFNKGGPPGREGAATEDAYCMFYELFLFVRGEFSGRWNIDDISLHRSLRSAQSSLPCWAMARDMFMTELGGRLYATIWAAIRSITVPVQTMCRPRYHAILSTFRLHRNVSLSGARRFLSSQVISFISAARLHLSRPSGNLAVPVGVFPCPEPGFG
ncbi:hypothetical protein J6590_006637 [Homalodisca vitripennis]|nr:hypothetical protein J6590_006637 [Homalodisca vitripennis]